MTVDVRYYRNVKQRMEELGELPRPRKKRLMLSGMTPLIMVSSGEDEQQ